MRWAIYPTPRKCTLHDDADDDSAFPPVDLCSYLSICAPGLRLTARQTSYRSPNLNHVVIRILFLLFTRCACALPLSHVSSGRAGWGELALIICVDDDDDDDDVAWQMASLQRLFPSISKQNKVLSASYVLREKKYFKPYI
jgi:hypothetical protein